jgi:hypothetical protein
MEHPMPQRGPEEIARTLPGLHPSIQQSPGLLDEFEPTQLPQYGEEQR